MITRVVRTMLIACLLLSHNAYSYTVVTVSDGLWSDPATWGGLVPDASAEIIVNHRVTLQAGSSIQVAALTIGGQLTLLSGATLQVTVPDRRVLVVTGILECADGSQVAGTTAVNTSFETGARYIHRQGPLGFIPMATWDLGSTLQISGFVNDGYINLAHSTSWRQSFGNVEYDCPSQTVFVVDLNANLRDIRGNLVVKNTNGKTLRLSTTQQGTINIGGNLVIEGTSQVWFTTSSPNFAINISGDFVFQSRATAASYLATRGAIKLTVSGDWLIDSQSVLRMASSAADSTGTRLARVSLGGDFNILHGSLIAPPPGSGKGIIDFVGTVPQRVGIAPIASPLVGNLEYNIAAGSRVILGESVLFSEGGSITVAGTLELGSTDAAGAIQTGNAAGNIRVPGARSYAAGSTIVYNGLGRQTLGAAHPAAAHTVIDNASGIVQNHDVLVGGNFTLVQGSIDQAGFGLIVEGNFQLSVPDTRLTDLRLVGPAIQQLDGRGVSIERFTIQKNSGRIDLRSDLLLTGRMEFGMSPVVLAANGYFTLVSTNDAPGHTGAVGPLPAGASIVGDVNVQRFLSGEGRLYRYISSPVTNATVASLMDDFPVTGTFADPSMGPGIKTGNPSLFEYDEATGNQMKGWTGYPRTGMAGAAPLKVGAGYAAFVRNRNSTVLDFTGPVNQGAVELPLGFTRHDGVANGWHLIGNPYPSSIDWDSDGVNKFDVSYVIAIRDNGDHRFRYWDGDNQYNEIPDGRIALGQGFWVRAMSAAALLTFHEDAKSFDAAFYRKAATPIPSLDIRITDGTTSDHCTLKLRRQSTANLDPWDGAKLLNDTLNLYMAGEEGVVLAIDSRRQLPDSINLLITELPPARYRLLLSAQDSLKFLTYYVRDHYLKQVVELPLGDSLTFEVTSDTASAMPNRFTLYPAPGRSNKSSAMFAEVDSSVQVDASLQMYPNPVSDRLILVDRNEESEGSQTITTAYGNRSIEVYNSSGKREAQVQFDIAGQEPGRITNVVEHGGYKRIEIDVHDLKPGVYLMKLSRKEQTLWLRFVKN